MADRPSTPPPQTTPGSLPRAPLTPEQVRQLEINRLKAKALREQNDAVQRTTRSTTASSLNPSQKRPHAFMSSASSSASRNHRDGTTATSGTAAGSLLPAPKDNELIRPAKKFEKSSYIDYDFSKMTDTKGGFLSSTDDPHNKALHSNANKRDDEQKPAHMTLAEWERHQLLRKLRAAKAGPFEPGISVLHGKNDAATKQCRECGSLEIDWTWDDVFDVRVCAACKDKIPEKYSLLTKTEAREDYLLTDPELKDDGLLPHLERPNPHKASYHSMQLFLRCQVEEYAFSARKWGSSEALDAEFERREAEKKARKEKRFKAKLDDLKKRTRVEAYRRSRQLGAPGGSGREAQFGDKVKGRFDRHEHEWGRPVEDPESGAVKKRCVECGMEVEELEF